jgi:hypothetical protein
MDVTADELAGALSRTRLGIEQVEEWKLGPTAMPSRPDDLANALLMKIGTAREERVAADAELSAMAALLPALPLVARLGVDARERVMDWARHRACDSLPPF